MDYGTFSAPDLSAFCGLSDLGLVATGQRITDDRADILCEVVPPDNDQDRFCSQCGAFAVIHDRQIRHLAHLPLGWRSTRLVIMVRRYQCKACKHVWRQDTSRAAEPSQKISRAGLWWALEALAVNFMSMLRAAKALGVAWSTANDAILAEGQRLLISDPARFDGVSVIGVDEHCWRHTGKGDKYVTVIIDLTPVRDNTGPSRLLDMVDGRSKEVFKSWLEQRPKQWRDNVEVIAMDGFTGFKTAAAEELPTATAVMDPFHVVRLAGDAVSECRRRVQQDTLGRRGQLGDPLYKSRNTLLKGVDLINDRQAERLTDLFAAEEHAPVEATWGIYQRIVLAYRNEDKASGKKRMEEVIKAIAKAVPDGLNELATLGRTLNRRLDDILAFFDIPGSSNGPSEAINGRLEYLRGIALGFRNLTNYIARALIHSGGFRPKFQRQTHP